MRFYRRLESDAKFLINRCYFEADHGRVALAVERLRDLADQFPENAHVAYAEGTIRRDYLGQGIRAKEQFHRAYELAVAANIRLETRWFSACNSTSLASNIDEFRRWVRIAREEAPHGHEAERQQFDCWLSWLDAGVPYFELLLRISDEDTESGPKAAVLEVALHTGELILERELNAHKGRAQALRALDDIAGRQRETIAEGFPPEERLALQEAIRDMEAAIALDEYDAVLWNYKSAWLVLMQRFEEAIDCADQAIMLRPHHYPRPHINKAYSLYSLNRNDEALECAREAERQAVGYESGAELVQAQRLVKTCSSPRPLQILDSMLPYIQRILSAARLASDEEMGQMRTGLSINLVVNRLISHSVSVRDNPARGYVPLIADLLADFTPESAFIASLCIAERNTHIVEYCIGAALYIAAHCDGVQRRDAARYFVLMLLVHEDSAELRAYYRQAILEPSAAARDAMAGLDAVVREELRKINTQLPELIGNQEPIDEAGKERAARLILSHFTGEPPQPLPTPLFNQALQLGQGCSKGLVAGLLLVALIISGYARFHS